MSAYLLPALIALLLAYGLLKKVDIYTAFIEGAKDALKLIVNILPYMAAMLIALNAFRACGAMGWFIKALSPVLNLLGMPIELVPLAVLKPFSGSASLGLIADILSQYGPDSFLGFCACVMAGSSETIFYTVSLYLGSIKIARTRYLLTVALLSGLIGVAVSIIVTQWFWPY